MCAAFVSDPQSTAHRDFHNNLHFPGGDSAGVMQGKERVFISCLALHKMVNIVSSHIMSHTDCTILDLALLETLLYKLNKVDYLW